MANKILPKDLPANLPENWAPSQIVSPDGTSAGLSEQHGYNYLMKQVNDAQKASKNHVNDPDSHPAKVTGNWMVINSQDLSLDWNTATADAIVAAMPDRSSVEVVISNNVNPFFPFTSSGVANGRLKVTRLTSNRVVFDYCSFDKELRAFKGNYDASWSGWLEVILDNYKANKATNLYIDPTSGNDGNTGTSETTPFRTINKAIDIFNKLPIKGIFNIHVKAGSVIDVGDALSVGDGSCSGGLFIRPYPTSGNVTFVCNSSKEIVPFGFSGLGQLGFNNITFDRRVEHASNSHCLSIYTTNQVSLSGVKVLHAVKSSIALGVYLSSCIATLITNLDVKNSHSAIQTDYATSVTLYGTVTGTNNNIGLNCRSAIIRKSDLNINLGATTAEHISRGGQIL